MAAFTRPGVSVFSMVADSTLRPFLLGEPAEPPDHGIERRLREPYRQAPGPARFAARERAAQPDSRAER